MNIKRISLLSLLGLTVVYFGVAWHFSSSVLYLEIRDCNQEHYVFCGDPSTQSINFENVEYTSKDGLTLPAWYMPVAGATNTVLLVHGRGASRHEGMRYAKPLVGAGYNVLAIDMRHPRQGEGIISTMGFYERNDVIAALDYIKNRTPKNEIGIMGFSMGAATSIAVMAEDHRIKTGVFNSGFANVTDVLTESAARMHSLPKYPLMPAVMSLFAFRSGVDTDLINPESYIAKISPRPVFIMHGTSDKTVGFTHGERLFSAAQAPKEFWAVEGGEHTRLWQSNPTLAVNKVLSFFKKTL